MKKLIEESKQERQPNEKSDEGEINYYGGRTACFCGPRKGP